MLNQPLEQKSSIDAKTAEEALALAIRLQQEGGSKVSMDQLQKTADEAGIDREYLYEALEKVRASKTVAPQQAPAARSDLETRRIRVMIAAMFVSMMIAITATKGASADLGPVFPAMIAAMVAVLIVIKRRRMR